MDLDIEKSSFRDPSGFLFRKDGLIYRQINTNYKENYDHFMSSGLYYKLVEQKLLVPHTEVELTAGVENAYKIIKPQMIDFISYPYEWSFSQLKDAALTTLKIQKLAFEHGMCLKDASSYNIQFLNGSPVLIDTLSFEIYKEGTPWVAYRQFCQHFLAPLALMSQKDIRLNQLLKIYIDGIPLDLASSLLPKSSYLKLYLLTNIHMHSKSQKKYEDKAVDVTKVKLSRLQFTGLIEGLESAVKRLKWKMTDTEWGDYYNITNYTNDSFENKKRLVETFIDKISPAFLWDLGSNNGEFSRIASNKGIKTISFDIDPVAVEKNYLYSMENGESNLLPLILDLTNPSPAIGWNNEERMAFKERKLPDTVMALALIHHLAISNNVPLYKLAEFFSQICYNLIIEFVPKSDSQVKKLLATREDIFNNYNQESFEHEFKKYFDISAAESIVGSDRTLYLMRKR
jgi:hypothetical protein